LQYLSGAIAVAADIADVPGLDVHADAHIDDCPSFCGCFAIQIPARQELRLPDFLAIVTDLDCCMEVCGAFAVTEELEEAVVVLEHWRSKEMGSQCAIGDTDALGGFLAREAFEHHGFEGGSDARWDFLGGVERLFLLPALAVGRRCVGRSDQVSGWHVFWLRRPRAREAATARLRVFLGFRQRTGLRFRDNVNAIHIVFSRFVKQLRGYPL
jgi:hypothetical protein